MARLSLNHLSKLPLPVKRTVMAFIPNVKLTTSLPDGSRLRYWARQYKSFIFRRIESWEHERVIFEHYGRFLTEGMIAFDIGANIGIHTLQIARRVGPSGRVVAFEPESRNLEMLRENLQLNAMLDRVGVVERAVDTTSGDAKFWRDEVMFATGSLTPRPDGNTVGNTYAGKPPKVTVMQTVSVDDYLYAHPRHVPAIVKIDVEGAEARVLRGMLQTIRRHHPQIILDEFDSDAANLLWDNGYALRDMIANRELARGEPLPFTALASFPQV